MYFVSERLGILQYGLYVWLKNWSGLSLLKSYRISEKTVEHSMMRIALQGDFTVTWPLT